jgi:hypothetical protein
LPDLAGVTEPSDWELIEQDAKALGELIALTADGCREQIRVIRPVLPDGCVNRLRERWSPLKRIAEAASPDWSNKVDELIIADVEAAKQLAENADVQVSVYSQLVRDLYAIIGQEPSFTPTTLLVSKLVKHNPEQWSSFSSYGKELTVQRLGRLLTNGYGVSSQRVGDSSRGYHSKQFQTIWVRLGISKVTPQRPTEPTEPTEPTAAAWDVPF